MFALSTTMFRTFVSGGSDATLVDHYSCYCRKGCRFNLQQVRNHLRHRLCTPFDNITFALGEVSEAGAVTGCYDGGYPRNRGMTNLLDRMQTPIVLANTFLKRFEVISGPQPGNFS